jgi:uncharacterized repeat protein (TIGR03806 family)
MPQRETGKIPALLSQTGAFKNVQTLEVSGGLVPYDLNVSFWSDGAAKQRWVAVPDNSRGIQFSVNDPFGFPPGTVFVKHFEMATDPAHPEHRRRLETRLLVRDADGGVYGAAYRWRPDGSDAELVSDPQTESITIHTSAGPHQQTWYFPGRTDCRTCHTATAGGVLGPKARQLNRDLTYGDDRTLNQLLAWSRFGLFENPPAPHSLASIPHLTPATDTSANLEHRVRSWLDVNCAQCHRPGGSAGNFDARYETPLNKQNLIDGPVLINLGLDHAKVIAPNDVWRSVLLARITTMDQPKMPPLAHNVIDAQGVKLLRDWIQSLPGPRVLAPPAFDPPGSDFKQAIEVKLRDEDPQAAIRYTLDGTVPTKSSPAYEHPLKITGPVTVRAKAFRPGFTSSVTSQETYIAGE